jgi:hypothetical protein
VGSQVGRAAFGPEQREASVAGQQVASGLSLSVGPADPGIAGPQMEGGAGPTQQANPLPILLDYIAQRLADHAMLFEVMVFSDQFVPPSFLLKAFNQLDSDRLSRGLSKDFADQVLRFRGAFYLGRTNHVAELGSLGGLCPAKSYTPLTNNTLRDSPPKPWLAARQEVGARPFPPLALRAHELAQGSRILLPKILAPVLNKTLFWAP